MTILGGELGNTGRNTGMSGGGPVVGPAVLRQVAARRLLLVVAVAWMVLGACGAGMRDGFGAGDEGGRVRVVATFSVLGNVVARVGGEDVVIRTLVGPNGDTHSFTPSPADQVAIVQADLVFENGLGYEVWLDRLMESSGSKARRVAVGEGAGIPGSGVGRRDPHVWLDVRNVIGFVETIRGALGEAAPEQGANFDGRALALTLELEELDAWIFGQIELIPPERRKLVSGHDSFGYFAGRYGLEVVGAVIPSVTDDLVAPTAGGMAALVDLIREEGVEVMFAENVSDSRLAERVAREAGVRLVAGLYTGALGGKAAVGRLMRG